jgi:hypothetical protein
VSEAFPGYRSRKRLEKGHARVDASSTHENCLNRFGNAMAAYLIRAIARHDSNNETTNDRHEKGEPVEMICGRRSELPAEAMVVKEISSGVDKVEQKVSQDSSGGSKHKRQAAEHEHAGIRGKVAQSGPYFNSWGNGCSGNGRHDYVGTRAENTAESLYQLGASLFQLLKMMSAESVQKLFAARRNAEQYTAVIEGVLCAAQESLLDGAIDQLYGTVVLEEHARGHVGDGGFKRIGHAVDALKKLILLGTQALLLGSGTAEMQKTAELKTELG